MPKLGGICVAGGLLLALLGALLGLAEVQSAIAVSLSGLTLVIAGFGYKFLR